jgi:hypothetical protein
VFAFAGLPEPVMAFDGAIATTTGGTIAPDRTIRSTPSRVRAADLTTILGIAHASHAAARDGHSDVRGHCRMSTNRTPMAGSRFGSGALVAGGPRGISPGSSH